MAQTFNLITEKPVTQFNCSPLSWPLKAIIYVFIYYFYTFFTLRHYENDDVNKSVMRLIRRRPVVWHMLALSRILETHSSTSGVVRICHCSGFCRLYPRVTFHFMSLTFSRVFFFLCYTCASCLCHSDCTYFSWLLLDQLCYAASHIFLPAFEACVFEYLIDALQLLIIKARFLAFLPARRGVLRLGPFYRNWQDCVVSLLGTLKLFRGEHVSFWTENHNIIFILLILVHIWRP